MTAKRPHQPTQELDLSCAPLRQNKGPDDEAGRLAGPEARVDPFELPAHLRPEAGPGSVSAPSHAGLGVLALVGAAGGHALAALEAAKSRPWSRADRLDCPDPQACARAVAEGDASAALLPWRNALGGVFEASFDALRRYGLSVVDAVRAPSRHALAARRPWRRHELRAVISHPEALRQCSELLAQLPSAAQQPAASTAAALGQLLEAPGARPWAILCRPDLARARGLHLLEEHAEDHPDNQDLFVLVRKRAESSEHRRPEGLGAKTLLSFGVDDRPGALFQALQSFAKRDVQLGHLHNRPLPGRPWEMEFWAEAEGDPGDERLGEALAELRTRVHELRIHGRWLEPSSASETLPSTQREIHADRPLEEATSLSTMDETQAQRLSHLRAQVKKTPLAANPDRSHIVHVGSHRVGEGFCLIAGPCSVESETQLERVAQAVAQEGGAMLRGGAFKPRTSPYSFCGLGEEGLRLLEAAGTRHKLPVVTEVMREEQVELVARYASVLQVGARNMQNFALLRALGRARRPVLLKRGMSASIEELLGAAEYILEGGNPDVILCERGIRTFETATRSTLDLSAVPVLRERTRLPIIVDPSHAAGVRRWVPALARAAKAVGADGIIVEVHPEPEKALSDGPQALTLPMWRELARELRSDLHAPSAAAKIGS